MTTANELLNELNAFRATEGKAPFADWRKARHLPMLEEYRARVDLGAPVVTEEDVAEEEAEDKAKVEPYKLLARMSDRKSTIEKPVNFIRAYLSENPKLTRKEAVANLVKMGVNFSTARTQYQKWYTANKKSDA